MSRNSIRKQSSYSQFRKKNSNSVTNIHKSMINVENTTNFFPDQKNLLISCLQQELQSIVRNRSLSNKSTPKSSSQENLKLIPSKNAEPLNLSLQNNQRGSQASLEHYQTFQKSSRSINYQNLSQTFQIIEESEIHNEQDNCFIDPTKQKNKVTAKIPSNYQKYSMHKKKQNIPSSKSISQKLQIEASLNELDEIQKSLDSVKKHKNQQPNDKKNKKTQLINKPSLKTDKKMNKATSQANFLSQKYKSAQIIKLKQITPKITSKKKVLISECVKMSGSEPVKIGFSQVKSSMFQQQKGQKELIPTKMITIQQKQKLVKQMDRIKDVMINTQISAQNWTKIKQAIKNIEQLTF